MSLPKPRSDRPNGATCSHRRPHHSTSTPAAYRTHTPAPAASRALHAAKRIIPAPHPRKTHTAAAHDRLPHARACRRRSRPPSRPTPTRRTSLAKTQSRTSSDVRTYAIVPMSAGMRAAKRTRKPRTAFRGAFIRMRAPRHRAPSTPRSGAHAAPCPTLWPPGTPLLPSLAHTPLAQKTTLPPKKKTHLRREPGKLLDPVVQHAEGADDEEGPGGAPLVPEVGAEGDGLEGLL
ncbi:hypothetical protein C8F04DRAFT_1261437 [Mycena alexandri]|uniref:Uncharacterized protein n=1 Tax=Mycena alexandri TaxID=1745969 RepID=A0AAD6X2W7_9AGAR|nr:hypothetical protein C8F04DRAFT_1261437 [Mycena alexandri]